jgi:phage terminase large subunit GpA-like protein
MLERCGFSPAQYDDEYFRQLTAEQIVTRFSKGYRKREWKKVRARNEALDCRVYALATYALLNANINQIANRIAMKSEAVEPKTETASPELGEWVALIFYTTLS